MSGQTWKPTYLTVNFGCPSLRRSKADFHLSCSLLSPIGEYRSRNVTPSKGKRAKKRKRKIDRTAQDQSTAFSDEGVSEKEALARLEMQNHLTIGFNTTTRYLENLAKKSNPNKTEALSPMMAIGTSTRAPLDHTNMKPLAAVFVARSSQPPALYSHLPLLAKTASLAAPSSPSIRIISLPEGAEDRLKTILGIRRLGVVGLIDGAPSASPLLELIRHSVPEVEVPWLQEAVEGAYLAVKLKAIQPGVPLNPP